MVILGGMGNVWGVALGGFLLAYVNYQGLFAAGHTFNVGDRRQHRHLRVLVPDLRQPRS